MTEERVGWSYKYNETGGELVAWWAQNGKGHEYFKYDGKEYSVYLEIHKNHTDYFLAVKVSVCDEQKQNRSKIRGELCERLKQSAKKHGWGAFVDKPKRFGHGKSMVVCRTTDNDCWLAKNAEGKLDMKTTVENFRKAAEILHDAVQ